MTHAANSGAFSGDTSSEQVQESDFWFTDPEGIEIFVRSWVPEAPCAAVYISHGVGEHSGRYLTFAKALASAGFAVYANDHRGHGQTGMKQWGQDRSRLGRLGPGGLRATENAITVLMALIRRAHPGLPVATFAHSWGSLMAQRLMNRIPELWDAVVLSGTAYRTARYMESRNLNRAWQSPTASGFEWLSSDEAIGKNFLRDQLNFLANIPALFGPVDAAKLLGVPRALSPKVPILLASGVDDPLSRADGLQRLQAALANAGAEDVELWEYDGKRHELLNEPGADTFVEQVIGWIRERLRVKDPNLANRAEEDTAQEAK